MLDDVLLINIVSYSLDISVETIGEIDSDDSTPRPLLAVLIQASY